MKVILLKTVKGLGKQGDVVNASDGHARNYLIPKGLAKEATEGSLKVLGKQKAAQDKRKKEELEEAKKLAAEISKCAIKIKSKAGEGGKLFGSITSKDIADELEKQYKIKVDKRKIVLNSSIKQVGTIELDVKVYPEVVAKIKVDITA